MANEYFRTFHTLCSSENRNSISQIDRKTEEFVQLIVFCLHLDMEILLHVFVLITFSCEIALLN